MGVFDTVSEYMNVSGGQGLLLVTLLSVVWLLAGRKDKRPPFPWTRLPIIGNMISLMFCKDKAYMLFYKTSKKPEYEKVFMIKIGSREFCVMNHIDSVREALVQKAEHYANRVRFYSLVVSLNGGNDVLLQDYGPTWRFHRKVMHQAFRAFGSGARLNHYVQTSTGRVIELIKQQTEPFNIKPFLELLQFNTFTGILFGKEYDLEDPGFKEFNDATKKGLEAFGSGSLADIFPRMAFISDLFIRQNPRDLTDYLLVTERELQDEGLLSEEDIVNMLLDIFGAGLDTINSVLMFSVANAVVNPDIQGKLSTEAERVLGQRLPVHADRVDLPYTEAFLCEVMRHDTLTVLGIPLETCCDTTIGKYELPKGTGVIINVWAMHNDPDYWTNPSEFSPDRFLDDAGELAHRPDSFIPFGHGKRKCPGENLSKSMLMIMLPMLFRNIKFMKTADFKLEYENTGIAHVAKPFKICAELRD